MTKTVPWLQRTPVKLFAVLADRSGRDEIMVALPPGATARSLLERIARQLPEIATLLASCRVACNDTFIDRDAPVRPGQQLAVIPPVSGG